VSAFSRRAIGFGKAARETYPALYMTGKIDEVQGVFRSEDTGKSWCGSTMTSTDTAR